MLIKSPVFMEYKKSHYFGADKTKRKQITIVINIYQELKVTDKRNSNVWILQFSIAYKHILSYF